ncbi:MAG: cytochrome C biogenesis protein CcmC [Acidimicrobiia bacterium]|nr:cytochrome C biogenesis protein CcmC [Acidimicrobiia bacterium]
MQKLTTPFIVLSAGMLLVAPWIINAAPYESTMGLVQKVFYFHFPVAILFLVSAIICGVNSARVLFWKNERADGWAVAAAELGFVLGALTLVTGPLWARKAWGVWWVWDARLTMSLVLFLTFAAYMLLRRYGGPGSDRLGAGMALFGMVNVPFIYVSVNVWRTLHPMTSVVPTLPTDMGIPLWFCFAAFTMLFVALLNLRATLEHQRTRLEALYLAQDEA